MVGGIINVAFGRHQCERQHPNFTKFATITCLPLPVIFPTWTKRLFDFQWRSHPDLLCSPVAVLCTNHNLENDCCRQFVKCKLGCQTENYSHHRWSVLRIVECIFCLREVYFREWWCWICDLLVTAGAHGGEPLDFVPKRQCLRAVNRLWILGYWYQLLCTLFQNSKI